MELELEKRWKYLNKIRGSPSEEDKKFFIDTLFSLADQYGYDEEDVKIALERIPSNILEHWVNRCVKGKEIDLGCVTGVLMRLVKYG